MSEELFISSGLGEESHGTTVGRGIKTLRKFRDARQMTSLSTPLSSALPPPPPPPFPVLVSAALVPGRGTFGGVSAWIGNVTRVFPALKLDSPRRALNLA